MKRDDENFSFPHLCSVPVVPDGVFVSLYVLLKEWMFGVVIFLCFIFSSIL